MWDFFYSKVVLHSKTTNNSQPPNIDNQLPMETTWSIDKIVCCAPVTGLHLCEHFAGGFTHPTSSPAGLSNSLYIHTPATVLHWSSDLEQDPHLSDLIFTAIQH